jgi:hypothetical protein
VLEVSVPGGLGEGAVGRGRRGILEQTHWTPVDVWGLMEQLMGYE